MADDPSKKRQDAKLVSMQPHEVQYLAQKHDLPVALVRDIVEREGPSRAAVESYLERMIRNRK
jgi:hypothetical protein